jgi:hypothetical protein
MKKDSRTVLGSIGISVSVRLRQIEAYVDRSRSNFDPTSWQTMSMPSRLAIASRQRICTKSEAALKSTRRQRAFPGAHHPAHHHCGLKKDKWSRDRRIAPKYVHHGL